MPPIENRLKGDKGRSREMSFEASVIIIHVGDNDDQNGVIAVAVMRSDDQI